MAAPNLLTEADWLIGDSECAEMLNRAMPQLLALDRQPEPLLCWLAARQTGRLGHYFELLVTYWLAFLIDAVWYATNKTVTAQRITLGEYDMLWRDESGLLHHWEVSAKLYLQVDRDRGFSGYIGTMKHDRLDLKVAHLRDKQLHLAYTPDGSAALPVPGEKVRARALFKGWLFYPLPRCDIFAAGISDQHLTGWWTCWQSPEFFLQPQFRWRILDRLSWLAPAQSRDAAELSAADVLETALADHFAVSCEPLLIAGLSPVEEKWEEVTRGFIVPPDW